MKLINIIIFSLITNCSSSTFNSSLALEITSDDYRSYRVSKRINEIFEYTGFIIAPSPKDSKAIIKRKGTYSIKDRYELYSAGDLLLGRKPKYGVTLVSINTDSLSLSLIHNFDEPTEERRKVNIKYIDNDNSFKTNNDEILSVNSQYYIHAEEADINIFASAYLNSKTIVFAPSVDIYKTISVPYREFVNKEELFNWAIKHLSSIGYKTIITANNIIIIFNEYDTFFSADKAKDRESKICKAIKNSSDIKIHTKEAKLVAVINTFSRLINNSSIISWPDNISDAKITVHGNVDVNGCELFLTILDVNNLKARATENGFEIITIEQNHR